MNATQALANNLSAAWGSNAQPSRKAKRLSAAARTATAAAAESDDPEDHKEADAAHSAAATAHVEAARTFAPGSPEHDGHNEIAADHAKNAWLHSGKHEGRVPAPTPPAAPEGAIAPPAPAAPAALAPAPAKNPVPPQFAKKPAPAPAAAPVAPAPAKPNPFTKKPAEAQAPVAPAAPAAPPAAPAPGGGSALDELAKRKGWQKPAAPVANEQGRDEKGRFASGGYHSANVDAALASGKAEQEDTSEAHRKAAAAHQAAFDAHKVYDKYNTAPWEREHHEKAVKYHLGKADKAAAPAANEDISGSNDLSPAELGDEADAASEAASEQGTATAHQAASSAHLFASAACLRAGDGAASEQHRFAALKHAEAARKLGTTRVKPTAKANEVAGNESFLWVNADYDNTDAASHLTRVQIAPYGDWPHSGVLQRFQRQDAEEIVRNFNAGGALANGEARPGLTQRLATAVMGLPWLIGHPDHPDFRDRYTDGGAYGRIKSFEVANDGLYAMVKFNKKGRDLVNEETYHGHSVNWRVREEAPGIWRPFDIKSVGFTNEPNIPVVPVTHANEGEEALATAANGSPDQPRDEQGRFASGGGPNIMEASPGGGIENMSSKDYAHRLSTRAHAASAKAEGSGDVYDHAEARTAHETAAMAHDKWGDKTLAAQHRTKAAGHWDKVTADLDHHPVANEVSLSDLRRQLQDAVAEDDRFDKEDAEAEESVIMPAATPYVADLEAPDAGSSQWQVVVQCGDGEYYELGFTVKDGRPVLDDGEPQCVEQRTEYVPAPGEDEDANELSAGTTPAGTATNNTGDDEVKLNQLAKMVGLDEAANETQIADRLTRVFGQPEVAAFANAAPDEKFPPWTKDLDEWKERAGKAEKELGNCMESLKGTVKSAQPSAANEALTECGAMRKVVEDTLANARQMTCDAALKAGLVTLADKAKLEQSLTNDFAGTVASLVARKPALQTTSAVAATGAGTRSTTLQDGASNGGAIRQLVNQIQVEASKKGVPMSYEDAWATAKRQQPALFANAPQAN